MKIKTILLFLLYVNIINSQSLFEKTDLVDEFGDKIGEVQMNASIGSFSNSATSSSPLLVKTILEEVPNFKSLDEYKEFMKQKLKKLGYSERKIKATLQYAEKSIKGTQNFNGTIQFKLYEYKDLKVDIKNIKKGIISIKTSEGKKIKAKLSYLAFREGAIIINGYKKLTTSPSGGIKRQIKYGFYDWAQSEIYNELVHSKGEVMIVIAFGNSTYKFTLE
ncbi:hypothetical protein H0I31_08995 [Tenacibaculum sp. AHE15PA]|uniref:hypothetical protein n=1 Tax=unclassified Tenacibaculum TaxID=2635139 RepID=UPI001C501911|nr:MULTISPECIES: hypothetical protein [unclassified Tenacibaculum]QXP74314.1 hypothetical protein H0I30_03975 [Tenacibaculum sp. AHE14PA]QXP75316.1 hypothetical protein H0I31_08995 [Tenacibaculum sp. AHE15PA]